MIKKTKADLRKEVGDMDFTKRVVMIKKQYLVEGKQEEKDRYFYCESGFGCNPRSRGSAVMGFFLNDGKQGRVERFMVDYVLLEVDDDVWARVDEVKAFIAKQESTCTQCGGEFVTGAVSVTGERTCKACMDKREVVQTA